MKRELVINVNSFKKSELSIDLYSILQTIFESDSELLKLILEREHSSYILKLLIDKELLKFTGGNLSDLEEYLKDSLDILDFVLSPKAKALFISDDKAEKIANVKNWIKEYRELFKGIKSGSMGDPNACLKKMMLFLKNNPQYTKEQIFTATKDYIKGTNPTYVMYADYFIYKTGNDKITTSKLLSWLEQMGSGEIKQGMSINQMV